LGQEFDLNFWSQKDNRVPSVIQKGHFYDTDNFLGLFKGVYMLQSLTQPKIMVSPQTDSTYIDKVHKAVGHKKVAATFAASAKRFWDITREHLEVNISA